MLAGTLQKIIVALRVHSQTSNPKLTNQPYYIHVTTDMRIVSWPKETERIKLLFFLKKPQTEKRMYLIMMNKHIHSANTYLQYILIQAQDVFKQRQTLIKACIYFISVLVNFTSSHLNAILFHCIC